MRATLLTLGLIALASHAEAQSCPQDGKVIAFDGRSRLGWACTDGAWEIRQEMTYAWVVKPEAIAQSYQKDPAK